MNQLEHLLRSSGNRLTAPRQAVFEALKNAAEPLALAQLQAACPQANRTSIYRTLELFASLGVIDIVHIGWKKRYELSDPFRPHHHHLQCTRCGQLVELKTPQLEHLIDQIATEHGYHITGHNFELSGICKTCQK